jgi:hypothetical protein
MITYLGFIEKRMQEGMDIDPQCLAIPLGSTYFFKIGVGGPGDSRLEAEDFS